MNLQQAYQHLTTRSSHCALFCLARQLTGLAKNEYRTLELFVWLNDSFFMDFVLPILGLSIQPPEISLAQHLVEPTSKTSSVKLEYWVKTIIRLENHQ